MTFLDTVFLYYTIVKHLRYAYDLILMKKRCKSMSNNNVRGKEAKMKRRSLVSYNAKGTNTLPIESHIFGITLSYQAFTAISNKRTDRVCVCVKATTSKTLQM